MTCVHPKLLYLNSKWRFKDASYQVNRIVLDEVCSAHFIFRGTAGLNLQYWSSFRHSRRCIEKILILFVIYCVVHMSVLTSLADQALLSPCRSAACPLAWVPKVPRCSYLPWLGCNDYWWEEVLKSCLSWFCLWSHAQVFGLGAPLPLHPA